jgi:hypothetical protein
MLSSQDSQLAMGGSDRLRFAAGFFFLLTLIVAAFASGRLHFGLDVPTPLRDTALIPFVASGLLQTWAMLVAVPASAIAPGSWISLIPAAGFVATIAKRARIPARIEDEFLIQNLAGYKSSATKNSSWPVPQDSGGVKHGYRI